MPRHIACITFDFDAASSFIAGGLTTPTQISRGEFGAVAVPRILALLRRFEVRATWFIPGHTIESYPVQCAAILDAGHEIGHHGWTHRTPVTMSRDEEEAELARGNAAIAGLTGGPARGYRSPSWDLSPHSIELLIAAGFFYETSMMGHDHTPYFARAHDEVTLEAPMKFGPVTSLIEMPISWSLDDFPHFELWSGEGGVWPGLRPAAGVLQNWVDDFSYMTQTEDWGVLTYTCHPAVIGRGHRMMMLEKLLDGLRGMDAAFLTMEEAAAEWRQGNA